MEFVYVAGGLFEMGCHANAGQCFDGEKPVRTVRLDGFWMGRHEVTVGQFKQFVNDSGYRTEAEQGEGCWVFDGNWKQNLGTSWRNPGFWQNANHPVTCASWNDTHAFARWLSNKSNQSFRLPSEAQWEYACRAGGKSITYGTPSGRLNSGSAKYNSPDGPVTVGSYPPNTLGLHDLSGNVWEWVLDKYTMNYGNIGTDNPIYERSGDSRVVRGGSWRLKSRSLRCSNRNYYDPSRRNSALGFRLLRIQ